MVNWRVLPQDFSDQAWDKILLSLPDYCVFQSSAWARHKRRSGWTALRLATGSEDKPLAAAQFLRRRYCLGADLLWSRGGPLGDPDIWGPNLLDGLRRACASSLIYTRICSYRALDEQVTPGRMADLSWRRPARALNSNATFLLDLTVGTEALQAKLSSNWAHNLRRSRKRCPAPRRWKDAHGAELIQIYRSMEEYKGVRAPYNADQLDSLMGCLEPGIILYRVEDEMGGTVAFRAAAMQGDKAWDLLAASNELGRKCYASYALLWAILEDCLARGIRQYDLGGADPEAAKGVYDFKKGTGARFIKYLGEWDWASPGWFRLPVGLAIGTRGL